MLAIVDCKPVRVVKAGVVVAKVTANPAEVACIAGELEREVVVGMRGDGDALLKLVTDGECRGPPGEFMLVVDDGEL